MADSSAPPQPARIDVVDSNGSAVARVPSGYRADIDGLRAVAVLAVVLYHLGIGPVTGGFVGVDMFYVISGFLITGIVKTEIDEQRFTFAGFYQRRVRRLFPALFAMLIVTSMLGIAFLLPTDLVLLGRSLCATLVFASNLYFWRNSGYFDGSADGSPLLHTWSLAVEEQFYIFFPMLLLLGHRHARARLPALLALITAATFVACVLLQADHPNATFYLAPFRAWELCIGALLAYGTIPHPPGRWPREALAALGALLIAFSLAWIKPDDAFPGWRAALPVLGTAMVIHAGCSGDTCTQRLLRLRPMVLVGLMSYSLYLWHWPLLVYARYLNDLAPLGPMKWPLLLVSLLVAAASYRYVETPFRRAKRRGQGTLSFAGVGALSIALLVVGVTAIRSHGLPSRFAARVVSLDRERTPFIPGVDCMNRSLNDEKFHGLCVLGSAGVEPSVLLWGDSHLLAWYPAIDRILRDHHLSGVFAGQSSCAPLVGIINPSEPLCHNHNDAVGQYLEHAPQLSTVILVASWSNYANEPARYTLSDDTGHRGNRAVFAPALRSTIGRLSRLQKRVWIIGPTPRASGDIPLQMAMASWKGEHEPAATSAADYTRQMMAFYAAATGLSDGRAVILSNPGAWLCANGAGCLYEVAGLPLYRDDGHLSVRGAQYLEPKLSADFDRLSGAIAAAESAKSASISP